MYNGGSRRPKRIETGLSWRSITTLRRDGSEAPWPSDELTNLPQRVCASA